MKMEALEVLEHRRAVRKFKAEQISDAELNAVLRAGTYAPTGMGKQSPVILAVQSPERVAKLDALNAKTLGMSGHPYYGAPTILLILVPEDAFTGELDGAAVCTNLLNAAYAAGLGSCWIHRCCEMFETAEGKALLAEWGLPGNLRGVASVALGYADGEPPKAAPRKQDYIVRL